MTLYKICMLALTGIAATMILKQWKSEILPLVRIGTSVLLTGLILQAATPIFTYLKSMLGMGEVGEYTELLFRALGIAILTEVVSDICKESGESGIASRVELMGKIELLLLSLPLLHKLLSTAQELFSLGGIT